MDRLLDKINENKFKEIKFSLILNKKVSNEKKYKKVKNALFYKNDNINFTFFWVNMNDRFNLKIVDIFEINLNLQTGFLVW